MEEEEAMEAKDMFTKSQVEEIRQQALTNGLDSLVCPCDQSRLEPHDLTIRRV